jgi:hypothetical protein
VSWNTAYEVDEANNGYSLTNGNFRQHSQIEFATGMYDSRYLLLGVPLLAKGKVSLILMHHAMKAYRGHGGNY